MKRPMWSCPARLTVLVLVASLLSASCGTMYPRYFGIRPDAPAPDVETPQDLTKECMRRVAPELAACLEECERRPDSNQADCRKKCRRCYPSQPANQVACEQYLQHVWWAQQLAEAYRSRASLNEWAIYVAGTIALAGLSVVSGLGIAAEASTEAIGLIGVSTGFTSGFFGFINNSAKAGFYTEAANHVSTALSTAAKMVGTSPTSKEYSGATQFLAESVSKIANVLETRRYEAAAAAAASRELQQTQEELKAIRETLRTSRQLQQAEQDRQALMAIIKTSRLERLEPPTTTAGATIGAVTSGIDLTKYKGRVMVVVGEQLVAGDVASQTEIRFTVPPLGPSASKTAKVSLFVHDVLVPGEPTLTYQ